MAPNPEPIPAVDYEAEVKKAYPKAQVGRYKPSVGACRFSVKDDWDSDEPMLLGISFIGKSEAWADAYSKLPQPTAGPGAEGEAMQILAAIVKDDAFAELCEGIGEEPQWLKDARALLARGGAK